MSPRLTYRRYISGICQVYPTIYTNDIPDIYQRYIRYIYGYGIYFEVGLYLVYYLVYTVDFSIYLVYTWYMLSIYECIIIHVVHNSMFWCRFSRFTSSWHFCTTPWPSRPCVPLHSALHAGAPEIYWIRRKTLSLFVIQLRCTYYYTETPSWAVSLTCAHEALDP